MVVLMSRPSVKVSPAQWKWAFRSPGARVVWAPTMNRNLASSSAVRLVAESMPAPSDDDELLDAVSGLEGLHDGDDRGGLGPIALKREEPAMRKEP